MHDYRELRVWQHARRVARDVYAFTDDFPRSELFGMTSQMRRAAVSVAANIAEGAGRRSTKEFRRFIRLATGSACELETHTLIAGDIPRLSQHIPATLTDDLDHLKRMLHRLEHSNPPSASSSPST